MATAFASLRPRQWAHFAVLPLAGVDLALTATVMVPALVRGVLIASLVLAFGYALNAISDRRVDRDRAKNPLVGFRGSLGLARALVIALALGALGLAATGPSTALVAALIAVASGTVYSVGPRLKAWPLVCTLLNVGCFAPLMLVGLGRDPVDDAQWALVAAFGGLLFQNQLLHEAADADEDRAAKLRTTFLVAGPRGTASLALLAGLWVTGASLWLLSERGASLLVAVHALPYVALFPRWLAREGRDGARMARRRRAHRLFSVASGALLFALTLGSGQS